MSDAARRAKARRARNTKNPLTMKMRTGKALHNPSNGSNISKNRLIETRTKFTEDGKKQKNDVICTKKK